MIWEVIRAGQEIFYQLVLFFKIFTNFIHPVHPDIQGVAKEWFGHISFFHFRHSFHLIKKQCQIQSGVFLLMHSKSKSLIITKKIIFERAQVTPPLHMISEYYLYQDYLFVCKSSLSITQVCKIIDLNRWMLWSPSMEEMQWVNIISVFHYTWFGLPVQNFRWQEIWNTLYFTSEEWCWLKMKNNLSVLDHVWIKVAYFTIQRHRYVHDWHVRCILCKLHLYIDSKLDVN